MSLMAMTMAVSAQMRSVGEVTVGDCRYTINEKDNTAAVCTGLSPAGEQKIYDIEVLEEVTIDGKSYKVTQIGQKAFYETGIKTITLPNTLERINSEAFSFSNIEEISFPESLRTIDGHAFFRCLSLEEINFARNGYLEISSRAFDTCPIKRLYFPKRGGLLMPQAYIRCDIEEIAFSEDCGMAISTASFYSNKVKEIIIPEEVMLGFRAFDGLSGLTRIVLKAKKNGERKGLTSGREFHGAGSYSGGNRLVEFVSESVLPPTILEDTFSDAQYATTTLVVPQEAIEDYRTATGWSKFVNVRAIAGVDDIAADKATVVSTELYDLYGCAVAEPHFGQIVIERSVMSDGTVRTSKRLH